jgi:hypothetical protein
MPMDTTAPHRTSATRRAARSSHRHPWLVRAHRAALIIFTTLVLFASSVSAQSAPEPPWATGDSRPRDLQIELLTFSPGDVIPSWFGHTAIAVVDRRHNIRRIYNYGMFNFDDEMLVNFTMGRLTFWVGEASYPGTLQMYKRLDRDVRIQVLDLPPEARMEVARKLAENIKPENRDYLYDHYYDNCSTRIRDLIDESIDGQLEEKTAAEQGSATLREHTRRHAYPNPVVDFLMTFGLNASVDEEITPWEEMFLPRELERNVDEMVYVDEDGRERPLVARKIVFYESDRRETPADPPLLWPWLLVLGGFAGGGALLLARWRSAHPEARGPRIAYGAYTAFFGAVLGGLGCVLAFLWVATDHVVAWRNWNLLLVHPLTAIIAPLGVFYALDRRWAARALRVLWLVHGAATLLALAIYFLPLVRQDTSVPLALFAPISLGFAAASWLLYRRAPALEEGTSDDDQARADDKTNEVES